MSSFTEIHVVRDIGYSNLLRGMRSEFRNYFTPWDAMTVAQKTSFARVLTIFHYKLPEHTDPLIGSCITDYQRSPWSDLKRKLPNSKIGTTHGRITAEDVFLYFFFTATRFSALLRSPNKPYPTLPLCRGLPYTLVKIISSPLK